jgi:predicted nucleic acid-binding protein
MKVFLDANILVAVLNREMPLFTYAARVISLHHYKPQYQVYTTPICLAIAYYFAEKKSGTKRAMEKITLLAENINVISVGNEHVMKIRGNPKVHDFEDGLQYYSAIEAGCQIIITENEKDFYFSEIPVYNSKYFILEVLR